LIDEAIVRFAVTPSPMNHAMFEHYHGAATRVGVTDTAVPHREAGCDLLLPSVWLDPADTHANVAWTREAYDAFSPHFADARRLNYLRDDEQNDAVRSACGPNYDRLVEVKRRRLGQRLPLEPERRVAPDRPGSDPSRLTPTHNGVSAREFLIEHLGSAIVIVSKVSRAAILRAAESDRLQRVVQGHGMRLGAARFVAGETLDECVAVMRRLNEAGLYANTTLLGEAILDPAGSSAVTDEYARILDRLVAEELRANVALKLTHLGLSFDEGAAYTNVERLVAHAADLRTFIRIDMEQSEYLDATLRIYERLRAAGHDNVGTVLQTYLYRTPDDLERLLPLRPNLRIVKGAYLEPAEIAYPEKENVDRAYLEIVERGLRGGAYIAVATHDEAIIRHVQAFAERENVGRDRFEFQMLYGVRPGLQRSIAAEGYKVLVATPFGPDWYPYLMRRLAERPANVGFFLRNLVRR